MKSTKYLWMVMCMMLMLLNVLERRDVKALKAKAIILQADLNIYRDAYHNAVGVGIWNGSAATTREPLRIYGTLYTNSYTNW